MRKKTHTFSLIIGLLLFAVFAIENLHGVHFIVKAFTVLMFTPALLYPLFFRPKHLLFRPPFIFLPQKPSGVSEDRWVIYAITCASIIASSLFYFAGQSLFHARASKFQTVNTEHVSVVGSIIAANVSGVLFLIKHSDDENWRYTEREYVFYPFEIIKSISDKAPNVEGS